MEKQIAQQDEIEIDLKEIFSVLWSHLAVIALVGVIVAALTGVGTKVLIQPEYSSTSKLYVSGNSSANTIASLTSLQLGSQLTADYAELLAARPVLEKVIEECDLDMEYKELEECLEVSTLTNTRVMTITVTYEDPKLAKKIVDTFANIAVDEISTVLESNEPVIVEDGYVSGIPSNKNLGKNTLLGGICGLVLAAFVIILRYILDDSIKASEDIERYLQIPTLGVIPMSASEENTQRVSVKK